MKSSVEAEKIAREIEARLSQLPMVATAAMRGVRREFSRKMVAAKAEVVIQVALRLREEKTGGSRFVGYELVREHKAAFASLRVAELLELGRGLDSWSAGDCFAMILSGPMWAEGRIADGTIMAWTRSEDRWWRRAALVSTVALSRTGEAKNVPKVIRICRLLSADCDDMVVKALSWALRELAKKHGAAARSFIGGQRPFLAARVVREVENKLTTGLKTPRRRPPR